MTDDLLHAAASLAGILARENTALATLDLAAAAALVAEKRLAAAAFAAAHARLAAAGAPLGSNRDALGQASWRLHDLAAENRTLLIRAMAVQARVLDIIAQAVPRASAQAPRYGAEGALVGHTHAPPVAIVASV